MIVHRGGVGEETSAVFWNTSGLGWCGILDQLHFQSWCSVDERKEKKSKMLKIEQK